MVVALELALWWAVCVGIWLASLSAYSSQELVVACGSALPCAAVAVAARRAVQGAWRPPADVARALLLLPAFVVADSARVVLATWRRGRRRSEFRTVRFRVDRGAARAAGRRAVSPVLLSATPATYVVDVDPRSGEALVHAVGRASRYERELTR